MKDYLSTHETIQQQITFCSKFLSGLAIISKETRWNHYLFSTSASFMVSTKWHFKPTCFATVAVALALFERNRPSVTIESQPLSRADAITNSSLRTCSIHVHACTSLSKQTKIVMILWTHSNGYNSYVGFESSAHTYYKSHVCTGPGNNSLITCRTIMKMFRNRFSVVYCIVVCGTQLKQMYN